MAKVKTGLTADSVKNMVFGAGVLFKNFSNGTHYKKTFDKTPLSGKEYYYMSGGSSGGVSYTLFDGTAFTSGTTYFEKYEGYGGDKIGATQGGAKASITPEYTDIDVDGVLVKMEGLTRKTGEKATIEATVIDMSPQNIVMAVNGTVSYTGTTTSTGNGVVNVNDLTEMGRLIGKRTYESQRALRADFDFDGIVTETDRNALDVYISGGSALTFKDYIITNMDSGLIEMKNCKRVTIDFGDAPVKVMFSVKEITNTRLWELRVDNIPEFTFHGYENHSTYLSGTHEIMIATANINTTGTFNVTWNSAGVF